MSKEYDWEKYRIDVKWYYDTYPCQRSRMEEAAHYTDSPTLEVGACDGFISSLIKGQGKQVIASDIGRANCKLAHNRGLDVMCCDIRYLPFKDECFHSVIACEVLEHLENMGPAMSEIQRVSFKRVIITLPLQNWKNEFTHRWDVNICNIYHNGNKVRSEDKIDDIVLVLDKKVPSFITDSKTS
jgi:ubiquinone/menaquinone biosynthesis C-methylase UbiE